MANGKTVAVLLGRYGGQYAGEAGIQLADKPVPLYQLLVLATLLSARIPAEVGVAAARELFAAGYRSPQTMNEASRQDRQDRVDALGRGHYRRYHEKTATMLGDGAGLLIGRWRGDLRHLRADADGKTAGIASLLTSFPGIGPVGASIFLREIQDIWPEVAPYVDVTMTKGARKVGLPAQSGELEELLMASGEPARLAAALVRVALSDHAARDVVARVAREPG
jgi:endonuclease III